MDNFEISIGLDTNDPFFKIKLREFFELPNGNIQSFSLTKKIDTLSEILAWCRFVSFNGDSAFFEQKADAAYSKMVSQQETQDDLKEYVNDIFSEPIDILNEIKAWNLIYSKINQLLSNYDTTLDEDFEILQNPKNGLSFN